MKKKRTLLRPLGSGLAMGVPLLLGILLKDPLISSVGAMGAFSYLAFQHVSFLYNFKAILLHGGALLLAFILGALTALAPWSAPFIIGCLSFSAFLLSKVYRIPKPDYFFVLMLYATGFNFHTVAVADIFHQSSYLLYGFAGSIVSGLLISLAEGLPLHSETTRFQRLSMKDKYYLALYQQPEMVLKALHLSMVLFIATYIAYLLRESNGYWILISAAAVLAGEHMEKIKNRTIGRVLGGIVGLLLGFLLMSLHLSLPALAVVLIILNVLTELYMPINYTVANFFTNPQVLLLMTIGSSFTPLQLIPLRFSGALIGSLLAMILIFVMDWSLKQMEQSMIHFKEK
ncbi:brp/Blh family beta-carotene 15,15'-monooxygenase [Enterococcus durans]|uniref:Brp/Blh family beta-carotene 15,15'-monooxygenase n=1 Tax=Enterococcus durans TaxID=53345 RepID=A0A377KL78_9ENTE|nr:FUSC family protein [Enterococcus durans]STP29154.1 brp/Blh family beta-carotene 15,15'-monooxygenase [Enterococcus durans]